MTDAEKLEAIGHVLDRHLSECNAEDGDRRLASPGYVIEAIVAAHAGQATSPVLRMFTDPGHV